MVGRLPVTGFFSTPCIVAGILIFLLASPVLSKYAHYSLSDSEIRDRKYACYSDIDSGLWGQRCRSSMIERENCALRCHSPVCYELIYENDPLEEGERDFLRSHDYTYCMHKSWIGRGGAFSGNYGPHPSQSHRPNTHRARSPFCIDDQITYGFVEAYTIVSIRRDRREPRWRTWSF